MASVLVGKDAKGRRICEEVNWVTVVSMTRRCSSRASGPSLLDSEISAPFSRFDRLRESRTLTAITEARESAIEESDDFCFRPGSGTCSGGSNQNHSQL